MSTPTHSSTYVLEASPKASQNEGRELDYPHYYPDFYALQSYLDGARSPCDDQEKGKDGGGEGQSGTEGSSDGCSDVGVDDEKECVDAERRDSRVELTYCEYGQVGRKFSGVSFYDYEKSSCPRRNSKKLDREDSEKLESGFDGGTDLVGEPDFTIEEAHAVRSPSLTYCTGRSQRDAYLSDKGKGQRRGYNALSMWRKMNWITVLGVSAGLLAAWIATDQLFAYFTTAVEEDFGWDSMQSGLTFTSFNTAQLVSVPLPVWLNKRVGPMMVMKIGMVILGATTISIAFFTTVWPIAIARFGQGVAMSCTDIANTAMIVEEFVGTEGPAVGLRELSIGIGVLVSPVIGGVLYSTGSFSLPFLFFGVLTFAMLVWVHVKVPVYIQRRRDLLGESFFEKEGESSGADTKLTWREIFNLTLVAGTLSMAICKAVIIGAIEPFLVTHLQRSLSIGSSVTGLLFGLRNAIEGVSALAAGFLIHSPQSPPKLVLLLGLVFTSVGVFFFSLPPFMVVDDASIRFVIIFFSYLLVGIGYGMVITAGFSVVYSSLPCRSDTAAVTGAVIILSNGLQPVAPVLAGWLIDDVLPASAENCRFSPRDGAEYDETCFSPLPLFFVAMSGVLLLVALFTLFCVKNVKLAPIRTFIAEKD